MKLKEIPLQRFANTKNRYASNRKILQPILALPISEKCAATSNIQLQSCAPV